MTGEWVWSEEEDEGEAPASDEDAPDRRPMNELQRADSSSDNDEVITRNYLKYLEN